MPDHLLARWFMAQGDYDKSIHHYRRLVELHPDNWVYQTELGDALKLAGRWKEALNAYARADFRYRYDQRLDLLLNLAIEAYRSGDMDMTENWLRAAQNVVPDHLAVQYYLALTHNSTIDLRLPLYLGYYDSPDAGLSSKMAAILCKTIEPGELVSSSATDVLEFWLRQGWLPQAQALADCTARRWPDSATVFWWQGKIAEYAGQYEQAITMYRKAVDANADFQDSRYSLIQLLFKVGVDHGREAVLASTATELQLHLNAHPNDLRSKVWLELICQHYPRSCGEVKRNPPNSSDIPMLPIDPWTLGDRQLQGYYIPDRDKFFRVGGGEIWLLWRTAVPTAATRPDTLRLSDEAFLEVRDVHNLAPNGGFELDVIPEGALSLGVIPKGYDGDLIYRGEPPGFGIRTVWRAGYRTQVLYLSGDRGYSMFSKLPSLEPGRPYLAAGWSRRSLGGGLPIGLTNHSQPFVVCSHVKGTTVRDGWAHAAGVLYAPTEYGAIRLCMYSWAEWPAEGEIDDLLLIPISPPHT